MQEESFRSMDGTVGLNGAAHAATKAIITLGPACQDVTLLSQLLDAGASCARCDLTWGSLEFQAHLLSNLQMAMHKTQKLCAIILDTSGRETVANMESNPGENGFPIYTRRLSAFPKDKVVLTANSVNGSEGDERVLPVSQPIFLSTCVKGETIVLGEYLAAGAGESSLYLTVVEVSETEVTCVARNEAHMSGLLSIFPIGRTNLKPSTELPVLSDSDMAALTYLSKEFEIDFLCLSFTEQASDIEAARGFLTSLGLEKTQVLAKLETGKALFQFQPIVEQADGVVLSRGNLALDVRPDKFALIQKAIIAKCNVAGKPVMVTRMLDSMVGSSQALRSEIAEVGTAVSDGCDAILLGAETARGRHPVSSVSELLHICREAERSFDRSAHFAKMQEGLKGLEDPQGLERVAATAIELSRDSQARVIILTPQPGMPVGLLTMYRPQVPILSVLIPTLKRADGDRWTLEGRGGARQCLIHRGLVPVLAQPSASVETLLREAIQMCFNNGMLQGSDRVVVVQKTEDGVTAKAIVANSFAEPLANSQQPPASNQKELLDGQSPGFAPQMQPALPNGAASGSSHANREWNGSPVQSWSPIDSGLSSPAEAQVPANGSRDDQRLYTLNPVYGEEQAGYSHGNGSPVPAALAGFRQASGNPEADMPLNQAPLHDDAVQPPARQPRHATQANVSGQATQPVANGFGGGAARNVRAGHNYRSPLRQTSDPTTHRQAWDQGRPNGHLYQGRSGNPLDRWQTALQPNQGASRHQEPMRSPLRGRFLGAHPASPPEANPQLSPLRARFPGSQPSSDVFQPGYGNDQYAQRQAPALSPGRFRGPSHQQEAPQPEWGLQTVRRDRESVPALVERAREVINRRMEKAPQNNWHSSFQRLYEPQTPGQSGWQQQSSDQRMASPEPMMRGPNTPDVREQQQHREAVPPNLSPLRQGRFSDASSYRPGLGRQASNASGITVNQAPLSREPSGYQRPYQPPANHRPISPLHGGWQSGGVNAGLSRHGSNAAQQRPANLSPSPIQRAQHMERGASQQLPGREHGWGQGNPVSNPMHRAASNIPQEGLDYAASQKLPRYASQPAGSYLPSLAQQGGTYGEQAERPVTVKQAREILGSISRNYPSSSGQGGMYSMGNAQASPQRFAQDSTAQASSSRERSISPLNKYPSNWYESAEQRPGVEQFSPGRSAARTPTRSMPVSNQQYSEPVQVAVEARGVLRNADAVSEEEARAAQANQAARVLHQAGLNLLQGSVTDANDVNSGFALSPRGSMPILEASPQERLKYEDHGGLYRGQSTALPQRGSHMLPDTFSEDRQTMAYRRIPRVVGGKVVPNLTSLTQAPANRAARRSIGAQKWNPSAPVIHEGFVKHDPLPRPRAQAPAPVFRSPLAGPASQSMPSHAIKQSLPSRQASVPSEQSRKPARTMDDISMQQKPKPKYSSSIMNSSPDVYLHGKDEEEDQLIASAQPVNAPDQSDRASMRSANRVPNGQPDMSRQLSGQTSLSGFSRQPSVPESSVLPNAMSTAGSVANGSVAGNGLSANEKMLPKQTSTAEEVMRDYLVGEGIKKAHFRALHPKAPKKKKTGFFSALLGRSSKKE